MRTKPRGWPVLSSIVFQRPSGEESAAYTDHVKIRIARTRNNLVIVAIKSFIKIIRVLVIPALDILPLCLADSAIAFKGFTVVFQSQQCFDGRAAKRVGQHLRPVAQDEQRIMSESHWQMANLHPSLGAPS